MLRGRDIQAIAGREKVRDTQIEKDYIINWLLWGISATPALRNALVFKGGTVLKKVWFRDYRFSEDLDFTLIEAAFSDEAIAAGFQNIVEIVEEASAIQLKLSEMEKHQSGSLNFYMYFTGPLGGKMGSKSVKIDITRGEQLQYAPVEKTVLNEYPDNPADHCSLLCYPLEEVAIEKLVALMGRTQPRDLYDLWYLLEENHVEIDFLKADFEAKARHKGHNPADFHTIWERKSKQFGSLWSQYLIHQIADLPDFDRVCREVNRHFRKF